MSNFVPRKYRTIAIDSIDPRAKVRCTDPNVVAEYAEALKHGAVFPRPIVYEDPQFPGVYHLPDGWHRVDAHKKCGRLEIAVDIRTGTLRTALLEAAGSNIKHGHRRSAADKRQAVMMVLGVDYQRTDNSIATHCGVSPTFVKDVRSDFDKEHGIAAGDASPRVAADGRQFKPRSPKPVLDDGAAGVVSEQVQPAPEALVVADEAPVEAPEVAALPLGVVDVDSEVLEHGAGIEATEHSADQVAEAEVETEAEVEVESEAEVEDVGVEVAPTMAPPPPEVDHATTSDEGAADEPQDADLGGAEEGLVGDGEPVVADVNAEGVLHIAPADDEAEAEDGAPPPAVDPISPEDPKVRLTGLTITVLTRQLEILHHDGVARSFIEAIVERIWGADDPVKDAE